MVKNFCCHALIPILHILVKRLFLEKSVIFFFSGKSITVYLHRDYIFEE